jgi:hypothetical protein
MMSPTPLRRPLVAVLLTLAIAAALLAARPSAHAQEAFTIEIRPEVAEDTAVRGLSFIRVTGTAPTPTGRITAARLVGLERGAEVSEQVFGAGIRNAPASNEVYVRNDDGTISGRLKLDACVFANPRGAASGCTADPLPATDVLLELEISSVAQRSNALRVDAAAPFFRRFELLSPTRIRAVFSEPVRSPNPNNSDSALDWQVSDPDRQVVNVLGPTEGDCQYQPGEDTRAGATGCTRILELAAGGEDQTPSVRYDPARGRNPYSDFASNNVLRGDDAGGIQEVVLDRVRPAVPSIDEIAGQDTDRDARVLANDDTPSLVVGNLTDGHDLIVTAQGARGDVEARVEDVDARDDGSVTVELPRLAADGEYRIIAVAIDPSGNRSDEREKGPARDDGAPNPAVYVLDTVAPLFLSAARVDTSTLRVVLSEAVAPDGDTGRWTIDGQDATASGSGAERTLRLGDGLPGSSAALPQGEIAVAWTATSATPLDPGTYRDEAGNASPNLERLPVVALAPVVAPVVTQPAGVTYTRGDSATIAGTGAGSALVAELFDRGGDSPRATTEVRDGAWSFTMGTPLDRTYAFEVRLRDTETGARSQRVSVPDIVRDTQAPTIDVTQPSRDPVRVTEGDLQGRRRVGVGDSVTVEWDANDAFGNSARVDIVTSSNARETANGLPFSTRRFPYTVTEADLRAAGSSHEASFRVTVDDLAGNRASDDSAPIVIDPFIVGYTPRFVENRIDRSVVEAVFLEALVGNTRPTDWTVGGITPRQVTMRTEGGRTIVTLVATQPITDPNAMPSVRFQAPSADPARLRAEDNREVSREERAAVDAIAPVLSIAAPADGPTSATAVQVSGETDETSAPNTVRAFRLDASGAKVGAAVASVQAEQDGDFALTVPLAENTLNAFVVEASDPSGNVNAPPPRTFAVLKDSILPVVAISEPAANARIGASVPIRWTTTDANPRLVDIDYRVNGGDFRPIVTNEPDDGAHDWTLPEDLDDGDVVDLRVTAVDRAFNRGATVQPGLLVDLTPANLLGARSTGPRTVDVVFDEPVVTEPGAAGFSLPGEAAVVAAEGEGPTRTLRLAADLTTTTPTVAYSGRGVTDTLGNTAPPAEVVAERGFAFAVTGLAAAAVDRDTVVLSWLDSRNKPEHIARYEVRRDGELVGQTTDKTFSEDGVRGTLTYAVVAVDDLGNVSAPASVSLDTEAPNIGPDGGFVISADGQVVLIVPPRAVDEFYFGRFDTASADTPGYRQVTGAYTLVVEAADDGAPLTAFARYAALSFRPTGGVAGELARVAVLRPTADGGDELSTRAGVDTAEAALLTPGTFVFGEALGATVRVKGPDPALDKNRFATAAGLSQLTFATADTAVLARADDYPDALAAAALARSVGGPVLLAQPDAIPLATQLELLRLGVTRVLLVGGPAALSDQVATAAAGLGLTVERVAGPTRYHTAVAIAQRLPEMPQHAYVATGKGFADALSASAGSAFLGRPIFLTEPDGLPQVTLDGLRAARITTVDLLGGPAAIDAGVEAQLRDAGFEVRRIAGPTRYETGVALARTLVADGMDVRRPITASGVGDGKSSPDALAAGPVAGRFASPLLLVPQETLHPAVGAYLQEADGMRGAVVAGGPAAVSATTRAEIDAAAR